MANKTKYYTFLHVLRKIALRLLVASKELVSFRR